jgi:hypothetical protein
MTTQAPTTDQPHAGRIVSAEPIDRPSEDGKYILRSGFRVTLDCGYVYTGAPHFYHPLGDLVPCAPHQETPR